MTTGILLTNIGSPDSPSVSDVRHYLKNFLSDPHVVKLPKIIWLPILYGYILPFRSRSSAKLYQKIWTENGSPLTYYSIELAKKLEKKIQLPVEIGMQYGNPTIESALEKLNEKKISQLIVLPLFPQFSQSTTLAAIASVNSILKKYPNIRETKFIEDYADNYFYIEAVANSIQTHWQKNKKPDHLVFSFHGLPKAFCENGDPYEVRCRLTVKLITEKLNLAENFWTLSFQSRLGKTKWLSPYTDQVLQQLPTQGKKIVDVICPGFAVDCLETLEEIAIRGKEQFEQASGKQLRYIPALNTNQHQVELLEGLLTVDCWTGTKSSAW